jgi:shikimate dehydrogenase
VAGVLTKTVHVGLIGTGIEASLTPRLHMQEGGEHGLDYSYELMELRSSDGVADELGRLLGDAESRGFRGVNITHPGKQSVIGHLDDLSDDARALNAVNTVVFSDGRRTGHNTDWSGFAESFRRGLPDMPRDTVLVVGAGGGGAAVAYAALVLGARSILIHDLKPELARRLARQLDQSFPSRRIAAAGDLATAAVLADGIIHATPTGMARYPGMPFPPELLDRSPWVADIVYFPLETELLAAARRRGCRVLDGGGMAVFQAVGAFRLFTGLEPNFERMLAHFAAMTGGP